MEVKCILCASTDKERRPRLETRPVIGHVEKGQPKQHQQIMDLIHEHHRKVHL